MFEHDVAMAKAQDAQHWQVDAKVTPRGDGSARPRHRRARRGRAQPLTGMAATAMFARPTDRRLDRTVTVSEDAPGHFHGSTDVAAGQWDLVIELSRQGERLFRSKNRVVIALSADDGRDPRSVDVRRAWRCRRVAYDARGRRRRLRRLHPQDRERTDQAAGRDRRAAQLHPAPARRRLAQRRDRRRPASSRRSKASVITPIHSRPSAPMPTRARRPNGC